MGELSSFLKQLQDTVSAPTFKQGLADLANATKQAVVAASTGTSTGETIQELSLESIRPSPFQARTDFDEPALKELAASMQSSGQLQPILVRPVDNAFELVAGERRWRAAKLAGWATLKAIVRPFNDAEAAVAGVLSTMQNDATCRLSRRRGSIRG